MLKFFVDNQRNKQTTRCVCDTSMPPKWPFLRNVVLILDLDLCRCVQMRRAFIPNMSLVTESI